MAADELDDDPLLEVAKAVAAGSRVDWAATERSMAARPELRAALSQMQLVAQLASVWSERYKAIADGAIEWRAPTADPAPRGAADGAAETPCAIIPDVTYVDSVVLDLTEWCCRKFQLLTGRTNVWLALQLTNLSIIVYFVWAGVYFLTSDLGSRVLMGMFLTGLLYLLTQTVFRVPIEAYENSAYRRVASGFRNPRRVRDAVLRISFLTLSLLLAYPVRLVYLHLRIRIVLLTYSLIVLTTVVLYLLACDPLPPCPGKVKEWLSILGLQVRPWKEESN